MRLIGWSQNPMEFFMEFMHGLNICKLVSHIAPECTNDKQLKVMLVMHCNNVREIITPIVIALDKLHKSGMIHRDISPMNIYIKYTGKSL